MNLQGKKRVTAGAGKRQANRSYRSALKAAKKANPDLPEKFVADILKSKAEADAGLLEPVEWGNKEFDGGG